MIPVNSRPGTRAMLIGMNWRRLSPLLALFFVVWLPLQSATALAMPIGACAHSMGTAAAEVGHEHGAMAGHDHADEHAAAHDHAASTDAPADSIASAADDSTPCNDCGLCQFACASALTSNAQRLPVLRAGSVADTVAAAFHSITPSLLQRPPRTA
jgi:hypothetical protein